TSAIVLEPVMGEGGIIPLDDEYLIAARQIADRKGALLIFDEIQCGLGRTGTMFAFQQSGVVPDMVTLAKPLGGGLPLGAVLTGSAIEGVVKPGHHGTTFGGNPVACRLGIAVLAEIRASQLLAKVQSIGEWFGAELKKLAAQTPAIVAVRGRGLMWGIELDRPAAPIARALLEKGFVVGTARDNVLRLLPAYVVPKKALAEFVSALSTLLNKECLVTGGWLLAPPPLQAPGTSHQAPHKEGAISK
ncbi:MAG: aspartate aminotransferase family protein, partial [Thermoanaerobaculia bacterium]